MRKRTIVLLALAGIFVGAVVAERVFLARLEDSVIHDDERLDAFLRSLHYPISIEPSFGFCRPGGVSWGYEYQLCVYSDYNPPGCPIDSLTLQYLGPMSKFSILSKEYHDSELVFRVPILNMETDGTVCSRYSGEKLNG